MNDRLDDTGSHLIVLEYLNQRPRILWKARSAETRAGMEKLGAYSPVKPHALGNLLYICPDCLAEIRNLIDK